MVFIEKPMGTYSWREKSHQLLCQDDALQGKITKSHEKDSR